jgi:DNA ligase-1
MGYFIRWKLLKKRVKDLKDARILVLDQRVITNEVELLVYEQEALDAGYEGLMLRTMNGGYKHGTSTENEGLLLKMKRFEDAEAKIIGFTERMHNENEKDAHGKRGTSKAGKSGLGTLGSLLVVGINGKYKGVEFDCPVPRPEDQALIWSNRPAFVGQICKYKFFPSGTKDKPRFPGFIGMRDKRDL